MFKDLFEHLVEGEKPNPDDIFKSATQEELFDRVPEFAKSAYREFGGEVHYLVTYGFWLFNTSPGVSRFVRWGKEHGLVRNSLLGLESLVVVLEKGQAVNTFVVLYTDSNQIYVHWDLREV